jgi:hypothetical protein
MHNHKTALFALTLLCCLAAACSLPGARATPTARILPTATQPPASPTAAQSPTPLLVSTLATLAAGPTSPALTQVFVTNVVATQLPATQVPSAVFCADAQATTLINNLKSALQTSNGSLLASLVSPTHGMDARLYRDGRIVNYDQAHTKFLFDSTYSVDWGASPGSGQETNGSFHQVIIPDLLDVFSRSYTLTCNQVQAGGASYPTTWPYTGINFYSVYYPGMAANGNLDWHTWLLGMHYVNGRPYLYAIMQFKWES